MFKNHLACGRNNINVQEKQKFGFKNERDRSDVYPFTAMHIIPPPHVPPPHVPPNSTSISGHTGLGAWLFTRNILFEV